MTSVACDTVNDIQFTLQPTNSVGKPAPIDAAASSWTMSDGASATVTVADDKLSAKAIIGTAEVFTLTASIDVDLGAGIETIVELFECTITDAKATQLNPSATLVPKA